MFPTEASAVQWFKAIQWLDGRRSGKCGGTHTRETSHPTMPYWCSACRSYFSVQTGTSLACSNIPLRKWAIAVHLCLTSQQSVSSMQLHRDLDVSQKTAWFMLHCIREALDAAGGPRHALEGMVEVDETYIGGKRKSMSNTWRKALVDAGHGTVGKMWWGARDRACQERSVGSQRGQRS